MNIFVDAMGGDNAPVEIVKGAVDAVKEYGVPLTLVGKEDIVKQELAKYPYPQDKIKVLHAQTVIGFDAGNGDPQKRGFLTGGGLKRHEGRS